MRIHYLNFIRMSLPIGLLTFTVSTANAQDIGNTNQVQKATSTFALDTVGLEKGYDTDRGFKHPGGLHTKADFERIRQQIKDNNEKVVSAYNILKNAEYSQSSCATYPVETIVRGGGSGENYINAARGATIAYQNALRWQIDGSKAHAAHAVDVLMKWARTTKYIGGDSNYALAAGLYGYQFAQAAELVRDYEGWSAEDFATFKKWMLNVWYPSCIGFLRGRNGTWENSDKWWQMPGHYWSNWGLCNVLAVMSIGILCDDVFIYNQGLSFFKYDMVGTFKDPRTDNPIKNDGLTEFLGNLVVTTQDSELETGAYGKLGQMQESGRDIGHATMAAGLAIDIAQMGWNQGDDLFSYMDHRLAAGIEYVAAQTQSIENLPWTNYHYGTNGLYWSDSRTWIQTGPALGQQIRPYWATVIGHYEGVKGVTMPFSEVAYEKMGIDGGGTGSTSGGYDHLGYTVLTHTMDGIAPAEKVPTPLTPVIEYDGKTVEHNELGGLYHTYKIEPTTALPKGTVLTLKPQLPEGETDTGNWEWNTGEKTKDITVTADNSHVWRATYTNANGVKSEQVFTVAVVGDCTESEVKTYMTVDGKTTETDSLTVLYGSNVKLEMNGKTGWGYYEWETGETSSSITLSSVTSDRDISGIFISQGGRKNLAKFHISVIMARPDITVNNNTYTDTLFVYVNEGDDVTLSATTNSSLKGSSYLWSNGSTDMAIKLDSVQTSGTYSVKYTLGNEEVNFDFKVYVIENDYRIYDIGDYYIMHEQSGTYLTNTGDGSAVVLREKDETTPKSQIWHIENGKPAASYNIKSLLDESFINNDGTMCTGTLKRFRFKGLAGLGNVDILKYSSSSVRYWVVADDCSIDFTTYKSPVDYPFILVAANTDGIKQSIYDRNSIIGVKYYTLGGAQTTIPQKGINIRKTTLSNGETICDKITIK